jgi:competence protein ComEC
MSGVRTIAHCVTIGLPACFVLAYLQSPLLLYRGIAAVLCASGGFAWYLHAPDLRKTICLFVSSCYLTYLLFGFAVATDIPRYAVPRSWIVGLEGCLVEDSALTQSGKQLFRLSLGSCTARDGTQGSAGGTIAVLCPLHEFVVGGSRIMVTGSFSPEGDLFLADGYRVREIGTVGYLRRSAMHRLENRLARTVADRQSRALASMLLLGRSSDDAFPLRQLGVESGCAFILALSGMHLSFFSRISCFLFSLPFGRRKGRKLSAVFPLSFVMLVGPKPALVRASGMYLCSTFTIRDEVGVYRDYWLAAMVHCLLFPRSLQSLGCVLSYAAFSGLLAGPLFWGRCSPLFRPLLLSGFAILFTAPVCLLEIGSWQLSALLVGPVASFLVSLAMLFSFLALLFGNPFSFCLSFLFRTIRSVLVFGTTFPTCSFSLYVAVLLTCVVGIGYAKRALQKKRRRSYELEFRIRFPGCHHRIAG